MRYLHADMRPGAAGKQVGDGILSLTQPIDG
ncbi:hypothetical protein J2X13_002418 [Aminobacter aminovorans]|nr:hypothetical protein [Aminobacter aminovorans]